MKNKAGYLRDVRLLADHITSVKTYDFQLHQFVKELATDYKAKYSMVRKHVVSAINQICNA